MSTTHEILKDAMSNAEPDDIQTHKDIYSFIKDNIKMLSTHETLPLHALTYAIRRILFPTFLLDQIPTLLEYLWHVDKYRSRAVEISSQIMTWQKFYKSDPTSNGQVRLLSAKHEKIIAGLKDNKKAARGREAFCECAIRCCRLHIYYLCTSQESHLLNLRLLTLFPSLRYGNGEAEAMDQFHWDFSKEEREDLDEAARQCVIFLSEETEWEQSRETYWKEKGLLWDDSYNGTFKAEFAKEFEPPYDVEETIRWMEAYLNRVEHMVQTLEDVFDM